MRSIQQPGSQRVAARFSGLRPIAIAMVLACSAGAVLAQPIPSTPVEIRVGSQPLGAALNELARQAKLQILVAPDLVAGKTAPAVQGTLAPEAALKQLLTGSGLEAVQQGGAVLIRRPPETGAALPTVTVTAETDANDLPRAYAGGQVARGGRVGMLGNRDVFETPFNVTNFTAQAIADKQAVTVGDIARLDPSVMVVSPGLTYSEEYLVRGFRVTQSSIGFDGTSGTFPNYGVGSLQAIERVEVFKGANTLLNGMVTGLTAGGYINLVPKRATDTPVADLTVGYASKSLFSTHADVGRRFGEDGQFGVRLNAAAQNGDSSFDRSHEKRQLAAVALDYRGEKTRLFLDVGDQVQDIRGGPISSMYIPAGIALPAVPRSGNNYGQSWSRSETRAQSGRFKAEYDLTPDTTAYLVYGGHQSKYEQVFNYGTLDDSAGNFTEGFQTGRGRVNVYTVQSGLDTKFNTGPVKHQVSLSATQTRSHYRFYYRPDSFTPGIPSNPSNIYNPVLLPEPTGVYFRPYEDIRSSSMERFTSVALADTLSLMNDRLLVTGGVRRQEIDTIRFDYDGLGTVTGSYAKGAITPVLGALFKVTDRVSVYGNYIESLDSGPTAPAGAVNAGDVFPPSKNKQYEIGTKINLGELAFTADIFDITQPSGRLNPSTLVFSVDGKQRNRGVEFNVFGKLAPTVRLNGGVMLLDAKMVSTENGTFDGKRVPGTARLNIAGSAEWDFVPSWTLIGGVRHTGAANIDSDNSRSVKGFTLFDLGVRYKTPSIAKGMTVRAGITNLADKTFFIADPWGSVFMSSPRAFNVSATVSF